MNPKINPNAKTKTVHVNVLIDNLEMFDKLYPNARSRFVNNAIAMSITNREFFDSIFYSFASTVNK